MSAGICIMNREAVAMAADSAVTIGNHAAIHNSANKLFSLSRLAPVGAIVYANADFMKVPFEIIIKQYKKQLKDRLFSTLKEYSDDFISYIKANTKLYRFEINEHAFILQFFENILRGFTGEYEKRVEGTEPLDDDAFKNATEGIFNDFLAFTEKISKRDDCNFEKYIKDNYYPKFISCVKSKPELNFLSDEQLKIIFEKTCYLFDTEWGNFVGLAIAGYGEEDIYPTLAQFRLYGVANKTLKCCPLEDIKISEDNGSTIQPLAQTDVMQTFFFGINDRFLLSLSDAIPKQINECLDLVDNAVFADGGKEIVQKKMSRLSEKIIEHIAEFAKTDYMYPIINSVESLPVTELAQLAESMINITSLRRKVVIDSNIGTVGGPIDVAVITKGDGFIWLKRKHYFDGKYNPQYFYSHFNRT